VVTLAWPVLFSLFVWFCLISFGVRLFPPETVSFETDWAAVFAFLGWSHSVFFRFLGLPVGAVLLALDRCPSFFFFHSLRFSSWSDPRFFTFFQSGPVLYFFFFHVFFFVIPCFVRLLLPSFFPRIPPTGFHTCFPLMILGTFSYFSPYSYFLFVFVPCLSRLYFSENRHLSRLAFLVFFH